MSWYFLSFYLEIMILWSIILVREYYAYMENNIFDKVKDFIDNADKELPIIILDEDNNEY